MTRPAVIPFAALLLAAVCASGASAQGRLLPTFKDALFAYPATLEQSADGAYRVFDYDEARDIDRRDAIAERKVRDAYIDRAISGEEQTVLMRGPAGESLHQSLGRASAASIIVIYVHGQGGNRKQGMADLTFGGNFNRLKNLVFRGGGLYLTPDITDLGEAGVDRVAALIDYYGDASPGAPVIVACGSAGGAICYGLARRAEVAERLGGLVLLGTFADGSLERTEAAHRRVPILIAHGGRDSVFAESAQRERFDALRDRQADYPVRMVVFDDGGHGTPIRMIDWRETLNWMMSENRL